jgi:hypothetical protein
VLACDAAAACLIGTPRHQVAGRQSNLTVGK